MFSGILPSGIFPRDCLLYWDGGPSDRINKTAFTNTNMAVGTNIHRANSLTFNGTTSKVDCSSQIAGTGNITVLAWINAIDAGESGVGRIIENGKVRLRIGADDLLYMTSDLSTEVGSGDALSYGSEVFVAVTRTSAGAVNFYMNGVLSGSADQASGAPANGDTNLIIGNNNAANGTFNGTISHVRIFSKILTPTQIAQIYNKER